MVSHVMTVCGVGRLLDHLIRCDIIGLKGGIMNHERFVIIILQFCTNHAYLATGCLARPPQPCFANLVCRTFLPSA